jgi:hypothetical protein
MIILYVYDMVIDTGDGYENDHEIFVTDANQDKVMKIVELVKTKEDGSIDDIYNGLLDSGYYLKTEVATKIVF